ncbi:MAG: glycosyltransferase family 9 protein [Planctomycetes bacterium]|nr:glycosyltransferase family 9 protein [Planctomycetota bacterium]
MRAPLSQCNRLCVILPSWIGDTVMATPALRALRVHLPQAHITLLGRAGLSTLLRGLPYFDECLEHPMRGWLGPLSNLGPIRAIKADAMLLFPNSLRSAIIALASGARTRIGWNRQHRGWLLTHPAAPPFMSTPHSSVDNYADLAALALGTTITDRAVELKCSPEELAEGERLLDGLARPRVIFNPGANRLDKRWSAENFGRLASILQKDLGAGVAVTGSPGEREVVDAVVAASGGSAISLVERGVTLAGLKGAIAQADLLVSNDTGPRHIAAGFGTPCVALFGPTDHRFTTLYERETAGSRSIREWLLVADPFLPREVIANHVAAIARMERISVGDVAHAAAALLRANRR